MLQEADALLKKLGLKASIFDVPQTPADAGEEEEQESEALPKQ